MIGQQFGDFKIIEEIGKGGMATVYKAMDIKDNKIYALKVLGGHLLDDMLRIDRFAWEAKTSIQLNNPYIVRTYDFGVLSGIYYIQMEYIDGPSLAILIEKRGGIPINQATGHLTQICEGLYYAHLVGVIHRDIKPSNVLITGKGVAKLSDFGIAKFDAQASLNPSRQGEFLGTAHYISPEQISGERIDKRSDIYSLGVLAYEMITGDKPFDGPTTWDILRKHMESEPPAIDKKRREVPEYLSHIVNRCLAKLPKDRFSDVKEMLDILKDQKIISKKPIHKKAQITVITSRKRFDYVLEGDRIYIGRDQMNHVILPDDMLISRRHAEIYRLGENFFIRDTGSRNGIFLNGQRITESLLRNDDQIEIGQSLIIFQV